LHLLGFGVSRRRAEAQRRNLGWWFSNTKMSSRKGINKQRERERDRHRDRERTCGFLTDVLCLLRKRWIEANLILQATTQIIRCFFVCDSTTLCSSYFIDTNYSQNHTHTHTHFGAQDFLVCPKHHARHSFNSSQAHEIELNWVQCKFKHWIQCCALLDWCPTLLKVIKSHTTQTCTLESFTFQNVLTTCNFKDPTPKHANESSQNKTWHQPCLLFILCALESHTYSPNILFNVLRQHLLHCNFNFWKIVKHFLLWRYILIFQHDLPLFKVFFNLLCKIWQIFKSKKV
jgi:hypothetical protein